MASPLTEENLRLHTDSLPRHSTISGLSASSKYNPMDDSESIPTISGKDIIMAFGGTPKAYVQKPTPQGSRLCNCLCWGRYFLFCINLIIWAAGLSLVGLGAWILIDGAGIGLYKHLFFVPGILLVSAGVLMVTVGICGWIGAIRQYVMCLRVFMVLVVIVFILQLAVGAMAFFMLDTLEKDMNYHTRKAVKEYGRQGQARADTDEQLDKLQREFECCGGSSMNDWEANPHYNCTFKAPHMCGVPNSCCKEPKEKDCGINVRDQPSNYAEFFVYTNGCIPNLMNKVKKHIMIVATISFSVCLLEVFAMILAGTVVKHTVYYKTLLAE